MVAKGERLKMNLAALLRPFLDSPSKIDGVEVLYMGGPRTRERVKSYEMRSEREWGGAVLMVILCKFYSHV